MPEKSDLTYPAEAYRSAIAFGQKVQNEKLALIEENARLALEAERL